MVGRERVISWPALHSSVQGVRGEVDFESALVFWPSYPRDVVMAYNQQYILAGQMHQAQVV